MRPDQILLLILAVMTTMFTVGFLALGLWFEALVVLVCGILACKFLPAFAVANRGQGKR